MVQPQHPSSAYDPHATIMSEQQGGVTASLPAAIGGWVIERRLGAGAMGEVFLAVSGQQRAALKLVAKRYAGDDAFTQRFQREIALLSSLDNPGVAKALDWGDLDGRPWLAMEYVDGPTVESMLESHGPFFEADVLRLAVQVAGGLDHIHQRAGLIHRDIKDRKSTRLNSSHRLTSRMPSSA
jgi:serine/threonine-protein kinase